MNVNFLKCFNEGWLIHDNKPYNKGIENKIMGVTGILEHNTKKVTQRVKIFDHIFQFTFVIA